MEKLLVITRHTPLPWEDGAGAYLHDLARFLAGRGFRVDILWLQPHEHLRWAKVWRLSPLFSSSVRLHVPDGIRFGRAFFFPDVVWHPFRAHMFDHVRRVLRVFGIDPPRRNPAPVRASEADASPPPRVWASAPTALEAAQVERFVARHRPDIVVANYAWMCPLFDLPALRSVRRVCLAHDIGWKRAALSSSAAPEFTRDEEAAWLRRARLLIAISKSDSDELRRLAPDARIVLAPKSAEPRAAVAQSPSRSLLFVGSANAFNAEGLEWFAREVWPLVLSRIPDASLQVCGSIGRLVTIRPIGVVFHGEVPSLDEYYENAAVVIVPLPRATGMNIKLVDAAAYGRAIVATSNTLHGAPLLRGAITAADSAADFADAVCRLLEDPAARAASAERARAAVREHLAPGACYGPLATLLGQPA